jgi:PAS domain S-box-containing protein
MGSRSESVDIYPGNELSVTLFEEAGDALFLFDPETEEICDVNPMAQRMSGFSRTELLHLQITYLFRSEIQGGLQRLRHAYKKTGVFHSQEGFLLRHHQEEAWIPVNLTITRLHGEVKTLGLVMARDIREHRKMYSELQRMDAELRRVLSCVSDCLWSAEVQSDGRMTYRYYSPVVEAMTGRSPEFFLAGPERWFGLIHPEDRASYSKTILQLKTGHSSREEAVYRILRPDGTLRWVRDSIRASREGPEDVFRLDGVLTDITKSQEAEKALRASEQRFRALVEKSKDAIALFDADGTIIYASPSTNDVLGYTHEEFFGRRALLDIHPEDFPRLRQLFREIQEGPGKSFSTELRYPHKDGSWRYLEGIAVNRMDDPAVQAIVANYRDITERKEAEAALRESEERFRQLVENSTDLICETNSEIRFTYLSPNYRDVLGYESHELLRRKVFDLVHPDDYSMVLADLSQPESKMTVYRFRHKNGQWRWFESTGKSYHRSAGDVRIVVFSRDISNRKHAEEEQKKSQDALRASEAKYRTLIENLEQNIFLKDRHLRFVAVNQVFCRQIGLPEQDIIGKTDFDFYPAHLAEKYQADDRRILAEGKRLELEEQNFSDGRLRTVRVIKTPVYDDQKSIAGVLGIFWDVTEQRSLESQLRHAQKMEAVGQLAGGVAHDFNNLLTVILGNVSLVKSALASSDPHRELLELTEHATLRAAELTSKLLGFSRRTPLRLESTTLTSALQETVALMQRTFDPRIKLVTHISPVPWEVQADLGQINQVLMNLCLNARDAMPHGGRLSLELENVTLTEEAAQLHLEARTGQFVRMRIRDSGEGILPEVLPHIFEPFFTTKEPGRGTGLGLAMVFGIIKQHQGWIECVSQRGQGTCFDVYLPRSSEKPDLKPIAAMAAMPQMGTETILLVDDEAMIRNLGRTSLARYGYRVLMAQDGAEALDVYRRNKASIKLVVLDLTMPRMSGQEAAQKLIEINPDVRILLATGYSTEQVLDADRHRIVGYIGKPFRPDDLARQVRAALDTVNKNNSEMAE